jgi:tetratricopeptide (TPR) repeat protein
MSVGLLQDMSEPMTVRIWAAEEDIPTYLVGEPNRNPMFLEKRVYQGSSGRVYPYPVIDKISDEKVVERHRVIHLKNRYLELMVLPDFGGRIQYARDKTNGYPFIYHNRVIKPALVGLAGPWLSGGIEFNWPQHHRPGTYCPVDSTITENPDGSMTLWLSEIEPMWHLKGTLGLTLYPDKAYLEINIRLFNPTPLPQSFHLWTNPAVHVNDDYQSVFPPDVQAVYDHGKRDVSAFPIARGTYYKVDYSRGVDISWYKNLPVPTSYMAAKSDYDFVGGYDHGEQAGVLHVADHHFVPGKKQWVWGCGDFGRAWDRNLTDEDGPYAELMCGVFADNQPDFSWLRPFEEKEVRQYFLPYKAIGFVRNATIHAAVSLAFNGGTAKIGAYATSLRRNALVRLSHRGKTVWEKQVELAPETPFAADAAVPKGGRAQDFRLEVLSAEGEQLVTYTPEPKQAAAIPEPATAIPEPSKVANNDALYLAGLHLEQFRHATREAEDYYREAIRRDPADPRNNHALGLLLLRRGQFAKAEPFLRKAIKTETRHNPNPVVGGPHYHLGVCLRYLGRLAESEAAFCKAAWDAACRDAACFQVAQLSAARGEFARALDFAERSLACNARNQKAAHVKIMLLRKLGRHAEAGALADAAIARDPLDFGARNERVLLLTADQRGRAEDERATLLGLLRGSEHTLIEIAADYAHAGACGEAMELLRYAALETPRAPLSENENGHGVRATGHVGPVGMPNSRPMVFYFLGFYASLNGDPAAGEYFALAAKEAPDRCFPNSLDSLLALQAALRLNPRDARAAYYLGNLWYDKRQVDNAVACWELSRKAGPDFPTVHRNLALAYFNKRNEPSRALKALAKAFALDTSDARVLFELDLLKKRAQVPPDRRLAFLQHHRKTVEEREDLLIEFVTLLNIFGRHKEALEILTARKFHPWEGGEGKVTGQYVVSLVELAKQKLLANETDSEGPHAKSGNGETPALQAVELLERARNYPPNLGEGKLHGALENHILYWLGVAHEKLGRAAAARRCWEEASTGLKVPTPAVYYNDQNPETIFYQGLALRKLGRAAAAKERFTTLAKFGRVHLRDRIVIDYFAVSLPEFMVFDDDLNRRNRVNCRYLMALGSLGLGRRTDAFKELSAVLKLDPGHLPARLHLRMLDDPGALELVGASAGRRRTSAGRANRGRVAGGRFGGGSAPEIRLPVAAAPPAR